MAKGNKKQNISKPPDKKKTTQNYWNNDRFLDWFCTYSSIYLVVGICS